MFEFYIVNVVSVVFATTTTTTKRWYLLGGGSQPAAHHFISGSVAIKMFVPAPYRSIMFFFLIVDSYAYQVDVKRAEKKQETRSAQTSTTSSSNGDLKVFVGGLGDNVTKDHLIDYFERFGTITDVVMISHRDTRKPRGFGFVTFDSKEATVKVLKDRFHYLNGIKVETKNAEPRYQRRYQNGHHYDSMNMVKGGMYSPHSRYYDSMDMAKGGMYSPHTLLYVPYYNGPYLAYPYSYPYHYTPMDYGYMGNQMDNTYDSRLSHVKGSQQKIGIPGSTCVKSDLAKSDSNLL
ncbi:hypothetical protein SORBI_3001G075800 [Sorghum bicolor]|uniref:RRM domain-containing protein n=3 Tax=Sorghum bicolor TaxID=4558 RepID=A0A1Z5S5A4_SORBI|nr:hypothetical protein SORBI_3001G075800 [Sorghum bicolor]